MNVTKAKVLKYALFLICDIIVFWGAVYLLVAAFFSIAILSRGWYYFLLFALYLIIRGAIISAVFKTLNESVFIYSTIASCAVFIIMLYDGSILTAIVSFFVVWSLSLITTFIPWSIYEAIRSKTEKGQVAVVINRYPYLETPQEHRLFEKARTRFDDFAADRQIEYPHFKEYIFKNLFQHNETDLRLACIAECKESLESLANEGVYYLMHFISLGAILKQKGEKVDFVGAELHHIQESKKLELLKCRINEQSYLQMEQELQELIEYYTVI